MTEKEYQRISQNIKATCVRKQAGAELYQAQHRVDEMQNKAEAQPAWLQLAAGA